MVRGADRREHVKPLATMFVEEISTGPLRRPEWFAARRSYELMHQSGRTAPNHPDSRPKMIGLTVGDGQGSASPKWAPAVERGSPTELQSVSGRE
jgi:hypothetical protein